MASNTELKADFFVIRIPRLSARIVKALPLTDAGLQDYLSSWLASPGVKEALYLASPSLIERLALWSVKPDSKSGIKVTYALLKYLIRMGCRPTPFGLFAGIASGNFSENTKLKPAPLTEERRKTRLDMFYLGTIQHDLIQNPAEIADCYYKPNASLYLLGHTYHYIEPYQSADKRQYRLSAVEQDEFLEAVLKLAQPGKQKAQLIQEFSELYPEADITEIEHYLQQLLQEQVLIPELKLPLTSGNTGVSFVTSLKQAGAQQTATVLEQILAKLQNHDCLNTCSPDEYRAMYLTLQQLPYKVSENKLFQTDAWRTMEQANIETSLLNTLRQAILALKAIAPEKKEHFDTFIRQFNQRFEGQFVPLLQVLDDEAGISFSSDTGYESPLLAGLNITASAHTDKSNHPNKLEQLLLRKIQLSHNTTCLQLESEELLKDRDQKTMLKQLPASFAANISLYQDDDNQLLVHLHGLSGPSGANLLGRFCHLDEQLLHQVKQYLKQEESLSPDVIFAEVVHMPDGRPGNVISRPSLRDYEIVFLADTTLPENKQIAVSDLYVFTEADQVKLWSKRLNKQVIPRLTCAHNYSAHALGIYRFLCTLQHQQAQLPHFVMPVSFNQMEYVPRIQLDNVILYETHWRVKRDMLAALMLNGKWQAEAWQKLHNRYQLDRYVCYAVADNVLTLDLHNPFMITLLLSETQNQQYILLKESLIMQYQSYTRNDDGPFAHEIIVPLLNHAAVPEQVLHENPQAQLNPKALRRFQPGSQWLSIKLYAAKSTAEQILLEEIKPLIETLHLQQNLQQWFFIRYADPDWHIRLRFYGNPQQLYSRLLPQLQQRLAPWLNSHKLHRVELFTYEQEVERYGGEHGIVLAERIFMADSDIVLQGLGLIAEFGESIRWRLALLLSDALLDAFGYSFPQKLQLISELRHKFGQEFQEHAQLRNQLGKKYRELNIYIEQDFNSRRQNDTHEPSVQQLLDVRQHYVQLLQPVTGQLLQLQHQGHLTCSQDTLLASLLHMLNNRIFKAYGREQEFVVYDFLRRRYLSEQARIQPDYNSEDISGQ
ncbi:lantibiotic dehydratase [Chromatiaceae bacterium AAb-1]|nr:lantibiotic dehydratase [Chromatiaceae bacterium AAb-1]